MTQWILLWLLFSFLYNDFGDQEWKDRGFKKGKSCRQKWRQSGTRGTKGNRKGRDEEKGKVRNKEGSRLEIEGAEKAAKNRGLF